MRLRRLARKMKGAGSPLPTEALRESGAEGRLGSCVSSFRQLITSDHGDRLDPRMSEAQRRGS